MIARSRPSWSNNRREGVRGTRSRRIAPADLEPKSEESRIRRQAGRVSSIVLRRHDRRRPAHAHERSKPPPCVGARSSRSIQERSAARQRVTAACVGASRVRGAGSCRRHRTRRWRCLEGDIGRQRSVSIGKGSSSRASRVGAGGRHRDAAARALSSHDPRKRSFGASIEVDRSGRVLPRATSSVP